MARGLNVFVAIGAKLLPSLNASAASAERRFGLMSNRMRLMNAEMGASWTGFQNNFSSFSHNVSIPAAMVTGFGARAVYEWSKVGNELQAVTQMSMAARKEIEAVARSMPGVSAENLSAALDLARTGFDAKAIVATLPVTIKLARADSSVDQAQAADIMTNVMKGMKLGEGPVEKIKRDADRVANAIAFGSANSSTDVRLMGESFKYAAPLASRLGMSVEELTAVFMTMADAGIKGSESGVALRSGMVRLLKPTKDAMAVLAKYGMNLSDYVTQSQAPTGSSIVEGLRAQAIAADHAKASIDALLANSNLSGADLIQRITEAVSGGIEEGADAADLDTIAEGVTNALASGVDKMDFGKFIADVQAKNWATGDMVRFFDVRQGARLSTLFGEDFWKNKKRVEAAQRGASGKGNFLDRMYAIQMQGATGPLMRLQQGFGNLFISMAESGVLETVAGLMDRIAGSVMRLSKTNPSVLKALTYGIIGLAVMAPLGFMLSGLAAMFGLLSGAAGILRLGLGLLLPNIVSTRIYMVAARYGIVAAITEIVKSFARLPIAAGAALGKTAAKLKAFRGFRVPGIAVPAAQGAAAAAGGASGVAGGAAASGAAGGAATAAGGAAGGLAARVAANPVVRVVLAGVKGIGPRLLALSTGWGSLIARGLLIGIGSLAGIAAGITAPVWVTIAVLGAAFVGLGILIKNNWQGIGAFFSSLWQSFAAKTAPLRESLGRLGNSMGNLGKAFVGWLGRIGRMATWPFRAMFAAVGQYFAPAVAWVKSAWATVAPVFRAAMPIIVAAISPVAGAIRTLVSWIKPAIKWVMNLLGPVATSKWKAWGSAAGGAIGGVVDRLKGFVDWVRKGVDGLTNFFNNSAQPAAGKGKRPAAPKSAVTKIAGARAKGGPVAFGKTYLVGEEGPELFTPDTSGAIIPNHKLQSATQMIGQAASPMDRQPVPPPAPFGKLETNGEFRAKAPPKPFVIRSAGSAVGPMPQRASAKGSGQSAQGMGAAVSVNPAVRGAFGLLPVPAPVVNIASRYLPGSGSQYVSASDRNGTQITYPTHSADRVGAPEGKRPVLPPFAAMMVASSAPLTSGAAPSTPAALGSRSNFGGAAGTVARRHQPISIVHGQAPGATAFHSSPQSAAGRSTSSAWARQGSVARIVQRRERAPSLAASAAAIAAMLAGTVALSDASPAEARESNTSAVVSALVQAEARRQAPSPENQKRTSEPARSGKTGKQIIVQPGGIVIKGVKDAREVEEAVERVLRRLARNDGYLSD